MEMLLNLPEERMLMEFLNLLKVYFKKNIKLPKIEQTTDQPKKENKLPKSRADEFVKTEL